MYCNCWHNQNVNCLTTKFVDYKVLKGNIEISRLDIFMSTALNVLEKHAPIKKRYVRGNESPFMSKPLKKEIMKRSRLKNKFLKDQNHENKLAYNKQRNICITMLRKAKRIILII